MNHNIDEVTECENVDREEGDKEIDREDSHYKGDGSVVYREYNWYASQVKDLLNEEHIFLPNFMHEFSSTKAHDQGHSNTPSTNKYAQTQAPKWNIICTNLHKRKYGGYI